MFHDTTRLAYQTPKHYRHGPDQPITRQTVKAVQVEALSKHQGLLSIEGVAHVLVQCPTQRHFDRVTRVYWNPVDEFKKHTQQESYNVTAATANS